MQLGLLNEEDWYKFNDELKVQLQIPAELQLRSYKGLAQAFYETVVGTAQFLSHKRSIAFFKGDSFLPQQVFPWFYREAYNLQLYTRKSVGDLKEWADGLKKDLLCVVYFEDHPITGELFDWQELDQLLADRKILSVRISHHATASSTAINSYSARVQALNPELAIVAMGSRFRSPPLLSVFMPWTGHPVSLPGNFVNRTLIEEFEAKLPFGFETLMRDKSRIWDRSFFSHESVSGEFLLQELAKRLNLNLLAPGLESRIETLNLCRWKNPRLFQDWWELAPADSVLQRSLLISAGLIQTEGDKILNILKEIPQAGRIEF